MNKLRDKKVERMKPTLAQLQTNIERSLCWNGGV